jgi:hypothetical protein
MKREPGTPCLSAVFVDYDNLYLSLRRRNEEAAKRFAKDAGLWLREIESGRLIGSVHGGACNFGRRIVMNRCYGNPVPRKLQRDSSATDMNSFPFIRHHFLKAGFEVIDCPPLTQQLKNSSDIRMVMDVLDHLDHETYFDEFIILSSDADFTPVLHRLRAHARRTVIYANEQTATPYTAICDGEVREEDLITLLLEGRIAEPARATSNERRLPSPEQQAEQRQEIVQQVVETVAAAPGPVPIETLADKAQRTLGHDKTVGTQWAGSGSFRSFLNENLPGDIQLSEKAPFVAYDANRHAPPAEMPQTMRPQAPAAGAMATPPGTIAPVQQPPAVSPRPASPMPHAAAVPPQQPAMAQPKPQQAAASVSGQQAQPPKRPGLLQQPIANLQKSIARIHDASQAPPLAPPEYRILFEAMAAEISEHGVAGNQTIANVANRARARGLELKRDDIRFVLDVVSEADPWFEQGATTNLFAGRFRNFVVARCRSQGLQLSADELDLIDAWFAGNGMPAASGTRPPGPPAQAAPVGQQAPARATYEEARADHDWQQQEQRHGQAAMMPSEPQPMPHEIAAMPRFVRGGGRG